MTIPEFTPDGLLPVGVHHASWHEFVDRFGFNRRRTEIVARALVALTEICRAGGRRVWIDGSFATDESDPRDIDVLYSIQGVQPRLLDPLWTDPARAAELRDAFDGHYIAVDEDDNDLENPRGLFLFFATDRDGRPKGIVEIDLASLPSV